MPTRISRAVRVLSLHISMSAESSTISTLSPSAGSQTVVAISSTSPPPGSDHGTLFPSVSTASCQLALTGSQSSLTVCVVISTGPSATLPTVSKRTRIVAAWMVISVSIRFVPAVSTTVTLRGNRANRTSVAASSPGPSTPSSSGPGPNSCATNPPPELRSPPESAVDRRAGHEVVVRDRDLDRQPRLDQLVPGSRGNLVGAAAQNDRERGKCGRQHAPMRHFPSALLVKACGISSFSSQLTVSFFPTL